MIRPTVTFFVLALLLTSSEATAQSKKAATDSFEKWLGPQKNSIADFGVVREVIDHRENRKLKLYDMGVKVVKGSELRVSDSENPLVVYEQGEFKQVKSFTADAESLYILTTFQLKKNQLGWVFYSLNVRVTDGELKGAIVHLRDDKIQESIKDPCFAIYKLPSDLKVKPGDLPFEVVSYFSK